MWSRLTYWKTNQPTVLRSSTNAQRSKRQKNHWNCFLEIESPIFGIGKTYFCLFLQGRAKGMSAKTHPLNLSLKLSINAKSFGISKRQYFPSSQLPCRIYATNTTNLLDTDKINITDKMQQFETIDQRWSFFMLMTPHPKLSNSPSLMHIYDKDYKCT